MLWLCGASALQLPPCSESAWSAFTCCSHLSSGMHRCPSAALLFIASTVNVDAILDQHLAHQPMLSWPPHPAPVHSAAHPSLPSLAGILLAAAASAIRPALWVLSFAAATPRGLSLLLYWAVLLAASLPLIHWVSAAHAMPTILVRKGYHLLALALFGPVLILEPQLLAVSLAVALALLVAVEVVRLGLVPFVGGLQLRSLVWG